MQIFVLLVIISHQSGPHLVLHLLADSCCGRFLLFQQRFIAASNLDVGMTLRPLCFLGRALHILVVEQTIDQVDLVLISFDLLQLLVSCLAVLAAIDLVAERKLLVELRLEGRLGPLLRLFHPVDPRAPKLALTELHGATHHFPLLLVLLGCFKVGACTLQSVPPAVHFPRGRRPLFVRIGAIVPLHHYLPLAPNVQILLLPEIDVQQVVYRCVFLGLAQLRLKMDDHARQL